MELKTAGYEILVDKLGELEERIAKLNKRARKLDLAPIFILKGATHVSVEKSPNGRNIEVVRMAITLTGEAPKLNGWTFAALLQHEGGGTIIKATPGVPEGALKRYRDSQPGCDHCQLWRRRNDTFVVMHDHGAMKQVGRNCLRDFLGHDNPHALAEYAELLMVAGDFCEAAGEEDFFGGEGFAPRSCGLPRFLGIVIAAIRESGWLSRTKAREMGRDGDATADRAIAEAFRKGDVPVVKGIVEDDFVEAARFLKFVTDKFDVTNPETLSDYEHNLRVAVLSGYVTNKTAGIAGSLVVYAQRELGKVAELEAVARGERGHVGTVGERISLVLKLTGTHSFETAFGSSTWVNFADEKGNKLCWKASGSPQAHYVDEGGLRHYPQTEVWPAHLETRRLVIGQSYEVTGKVEKHGLNRRDGVTPETILKRCFIAEVGVSAWQEAVKVQAKEAKKVAAREKRAARKKEKEAGSETPGPLFNKGTAA